MHLVAGDNIPVLEIRSLAIVRRGLPLAERYP